MIRGYKVHHWLRDKKLYLTEKCMLNCFKIIG
jgi:hypothetical protein